MNKKSTNEVGVIRRDGGEKWKKEKGRTKYHRERKEEEGRCRGGGGRRTVRKVLSGAVCLTCHESGVEDRRRKVNARLLSL